MHRIAFFLVLLTAAFAHAKSPIFKAKATAPAPVVIPVPTKSALKSFRDWKADKVQAAQNQVEKTTKYMIALKVRGTLNEKQRESLEQQIAQEQWNVEVAQDLSVMDYLVLYLAQQGGPGKFNEAATKLTADETAQVLEAYVRSNGGTSEQNQVVFPTSAAQNR